MIERRASLTSRVIPPAEKAYADSIQRAIDDLIAQLLKLSPKNVWKRERISYMISVLEETLKGHTKQFEGDIWKDATEIAYIDNKAGARDYSILTDLGRKDKEASPYVFKPLSKSTIRKLIKVDYLTFSYLNAEGKKKYSSISLQSALRGAHVKTIEEANSILVAGAINALTPAQIVSQLKPVNSKARSMLRTTVRTLLADSNNRANYELLESHRKYFDYYQFVATLDNRTSSLCRTLDGRRFKEVPKMYQPPLHPNCRSLITVSYHGADPKTRTIVMPNGDVKVVDGKLTYRELVKIYPEIDNRKTIDIKEYERLMLQGL